MKKLLTTKMIVVASIFAVLLFSVGSVAYAGFQGFGYSLPQFQENVTLQAGSRSASSASASVNVHNGGSQRFWIWCDAPHVGSRLTNSVLVTGNNFYSLSYWNRTASNVYLRGCTDGWTGGHYVSGNVNF